MDLREFNRIRVRIIDRNGDLFEGLSTYNSAEYNLTRFGRSEESLQILSFPFYAGDIRDVESLEGNDGIYGVFSAPFGNIEEMTVIGGIDTIAEVLFSDDAEHIVRLLACLERYFLPGTSHTLACREAVIDALTELMTVSGDERVRAEAASLLDMAGRGDD